jgi:transposase
MRQGGLTLFAALEVATGQVTGRHYKRRRRLEFLDFMNRMVRLYQGNDIHVILDKLSTHKPKRDRWLARHPNVHFHYTPTHGSWLNQIEIWFSILSAKSLKGDSFASVPLLVNTSTASSPAITQTPSPSFGPKVPSTRSASNHVSRSSDSGY